MRPKYLLYALATPIVMVGLMVGVTTAFAQPDYDVVDSNDGWPIGNMVVRTIEPPAISVPVAMNRSGWNGCAAGCPDFCDWHTDSPCTACFIDMDEGHADGQYEWPPGEHFHHFTIAALTEAQQREVRLAAMSEGDLADSVLGAVR